MFHKVCNPFQRIQEPIGTFGGTNQIDREPNTTFSGMYKRVSRPNDDVIRKSIGNLS